MQQACGHSAPLPRVTQDRALGWLDCRPSCISDSSRRPWAAQGEALARRVHAHVAEGCLGGSQGEGGTGPGSWEGDSVEWMPQVLNLGFAGRATLGKNHSGLCLRAEGDGRTGLFSQGGRLSN